MEQDCSFTRDGNYFRYRAAGIIVEDDCVLLVGNEKENFLYSVGGGVHLGETAEDAVIRECLEETGVRFEIDRLAVIHESFWNGNGAYDKDLVCHEISFFFLMKPRGTKELHSDSLTRFGDREEVRWIPIKDLPRYKVFPTFLSDYLGRSHTGIEHILTDERK